VWNEGIGSIGEPRSRYGDGNVSSGCDKREVGREGGADGNGGQKDSPPW
jgi:hypothetical protein